MMRVFIAGKGAISAIGNNVPQTLLAFRNLKSGVDKISILRTNYAETLPAAEVKMTNEELIQLAGAHSDSRNALLSMIAAKEALADANIPDIKNWRTGFISANTVGGMDITE